MRTREIGQTSTVVAFLAVLVITSAPAASAQTDEIQVYDGALTEPGVFNLMVHNNFTPSGQKTPAFPGANVADKSLNGMPEWAYGVTRWFEAGLYMPLYSLARHGGFTFNGFKLRALFVEPDAANQRFVYGINFEFSYNTQHWNQNRYTQEIRPIIGWHLGRFDIIVNPILDNSYKGFSALDLAPATRVAFNINKIWAVAAEEYDDFGPLRAFHASGQQQHQLFGVLDYNGKPWMIEGGVGFGLTSA